MTVSGVAKPTVVVPRQGLAGQKVLPRPAAKMYEQVQLRALRSAGFDPKRGRAVLQAISTLAWTA